MVIHKYRLVYQPYFGVKVLIFLIMAKIRGQSWQKTRDEGGKGPRKIKDNGGKSTKGKEKDKVGTKRTI